MWCVSSALYFHRTLFLSGDNVEEAVERVSLTSQGVMEIVHVQYDERGIAKSYSEEGTELRSVIFYTNSSDCKRNTYPYKILKL